MHRARLLRSTPLRLAVSFGLFFIVAFFITGLVAYGLMRRELARSLDVSIMDTYSIVQSTYSSNDLEDLVAAVDTYSALKRSEDQVFLLLDGNGKKLAGNVPAISVTPGISTLPSTAFGLKGNDPIRIMAGSVGDNRLIVGQSYKETDRIERIALMSFAWASVIIVATVIVGGAVLARRTQHRLRSIEQTMIEVSAGNLSRRIPTRGNGDDIDVVSSHMNDALVRLSGLVEGMRQVSTDIAHDLKTPLNRLRLTIGLQVQQQQRAFGQQRAAANRTQIVEQRQQNQGEIATTCEHALQVTRELNHGAHQRVEALRLALTFVGCREQVAGDLLHFFRQQRRAIDFKDAQNALNLMQLCGAAFKQRRVVRLLDIAFESRTRIAERRIQLTADEFESL